MMNDLVRNWRLIVWRGILAVLLGLAAFLWPGLRGLHMVLLFGVYALADGLIVEGTSLLRAGDPLRWWAFLLEGLVSIVAGVMALVQPGMTAWMLVFLIAMWAMITGVLEIVAAMRLRNVLTNEWLLAWGGGISIALGVLAFFQPRPGDSTVIWGMGAYGLSFGLLLLMLGLGLRNQNVRSERRFIRLA